MESGSGQSVACCYFLFSFGMDLATPQWHPVFHIETETFHKCVEDHMCRKVEK